MSDTAAFPFDSAKVPDAGADKDRRKLFLLLGLGVVLVIAVGYVLITTVFGVGAPAKGVPPNMAWITRPAAVPAPGVGTVPLPSASPVAVPKGFLGAASRNPFIPLVVEPPTATTAGGAPTGSAAPTVPTAPGQPSTSPAPTS